MQLDYKFLRCRGATRTAAECRTDEDACIAALQAQPATAPSVSVPPVSHFIYPEYIPAPATRPSDLFLSPAASQPPAKRRRGSPEQSQ